MDPKDLDNIDCLQFMDRINDAIDETQDRVASKIIAEQEYRAQLEGCIFETRDILHKMQENSEKESKYNHRANTIVIVIVALTLIATVVSTAISLLH